MAGARASLVALTAAVCGLSAREGSALSLRAGPSSEPRSLEAQRVANIGSVMAGQDMLVFDLWSTQGARAAVFAASYAGGKTTADKLWEVPDGYDISQTTLCSSSAESAQVSGETSLMATQTTEVKFSVSAGYGPVSGSLENNNLFKASSKMMSSNDSVLPVSSLTCKLYQVVFNTFGMPAMTGNFADGLDFLRVALANNGSLPTPAPAPTVPPSAAPTTATPTTATPGPAPSGAPTASGTCVCLSTGLGNVPDWWCQDNNCAAEYVQAGQCRWDCPATAVAAAAPRCSLPTFCKSARCQAVLRGSCLPGAAPGASQYTPAEAAEAFLGEFGTHYMTRGSLGSAFMSTTSTTREQQSQIESSSTSVQVAAEAALWGQSVGTSVLRGNEKEEAASFEKFSTNVASRTIGVTLPTCPAAPAECSKDAIVAKWQGDTINSNGLALVGGLMFSRLDQLLILPSALKVANAALDNGAQPFTQEELDAVRELLTKSIDGYCAAMHMDCDGPTPDKPLPAPATVTTSRDPNMYGSSGGGNRFNGVSGDYIAGKFGKPTLTYDIRPVKVDAWFKPHNGATILCALQTTYRNSAGDEQASSWNGNMNECKGTSGSSLCSKSWDYGVQINAWQVHAGSWVDGFTLWPKGGGAAIKCGTDGGYEYDKVTLIGSKYWFGFDGLGGSWIDMIQMLTADTVTH